MAPNLAPISEADWLLPDTEAGDWLAEKRELMARCREAVLAILPSAAAASDEAGDMIFDHLGQKRGLQSASKFEDAARYVSDDLCIMQENTSGDWVLSAAIVCAPTYWSLAEYIGQPLHILHGPVPGGDPQLASRIGRIFTALRPEQILERCNWTVQAGGQRFTPESAPLKLAAAAMNPEEALTGLYLRVERQTVRKLPQTGAVLFTIRVCVDPLAAVFAVPGARQAFAHAWNNAPPDVAAYKGWDAYQHLVKAVIV